MCWAFLEEANADAVKLHVGDTSFESATTARCVKWQTEAD